MSTADPADRRTPESAEPNPETLSDDGFLGGALRLHQPRSGYRAGIDAVLLAATVPTRQHNANNATPTPKILDVGAGVGTVGMCVAHRLKNGHVTLVEKSPELAAIARINATRNALDDRLEIITADITAPGQEIDRTQLTERGYDYVLANPPFHDTGKGTPASTELKSHAHAMDQHDLDRWLRFMTRMCAPGGFATLIHKAQNLPRLLEAMDGRFGAIRVLPIHPRAGTKASRVIITGKKGSKAELTICPGLILHTDTHAYNADVDAILRTGTSLKIL